MEQAKVYEFGKGRPKGVLNKSTRARNNFYREQFEKLKLLDLSAEELSRRLKEEPETFKNTELIKVIKDVGPYLMQTVSEEKIEEQIEETINTKEAAEQSLSSIMEFITKMKEQREGKA
ncbi:hypothetical protein R3B00_001308 [Klebsiella pneumoniae]|nr:hypothetical protein [Klebsiella pneumoniae]ELQ8980646.1 hypothetical protein [Klebsiella pneumoniae]